jgi:hypothetical protein
MQTDKPKRSSSVPVVISGPQIRSAVLKRFLYDLANTRDEAKSFERLRRRFRSFLTDRPSISQLALYRDELRLLWHATDGIPEQDWKDFEEWQKIRPDAEPGEMICNRWLKRSEVGLLAVWEKSRRELIPGSADLPAILVYGCLLFADRLFYCGNPDCLAPWFIGTRRGQQYCSDECSRPAKKAAKRKWWAANRAKSIALLSPKRRTKR